MKKARDIFIAGLKDAYSMELQAKDMMESQAKRLEDYPAVRARAEAHRKETEEQIVRLDEALGIVGQQPSKLKNLATRTAGTIQGTIHGLVSDEIIKDILATYAFEHLEIASYRLLIAMASELGENRIADLCRASLQEEEAMANWLSGNMDETARVFVTRHS